MIKAIIKNKDTGREVLFMVLSRANLDNMQNGNPVHFHTEQMLLSEIKCKEVLIGFYETEELALEDMKKHGFLEDVKVSHDKPGPSN